METEFLLPSGADTAGVNGNINIAVDAMKSTLPGIEEDISEEDDAGKLFNVV